MRYRKLECSLEHTDLENTDWYYANMKAKTFCFFSDSCGADQPSTRMDEQLYSDLRAVQEFGFIAIRREEHWPMLYYDLDRISLKEACELFKSFTKEN